MSLTPAPQNEQACYDLGYGNPAKHHREYEWKHVVLLNAYHAGQMDYQNQQPRNRQYDRSQYDALTGERLTLGERKSGREKWMRMIQSTKQ